MLVRPTRTAHARCDGDAEEGATKKQRPTDSETPLLLTTEFNYQYRLYGGVWISYKEPQDEKPRLTPVLMSGLLSPVGAPEIVEVNGLYLYNTKYLRDTQMDYDHLIPDEAIGVNVWVLSDNHVHVTGARPSSAWKGVPVVVNGDAKMVAVDTGTEMIATDHTCGKDPNGHGEETLLFLGAVNLAKRKTSKRWKDQVIKFTALTVDALDSVDPLLIALGLKPRWDPRQLIERVPRALLMLPHATRAAAAELDIESGMFEGRWYDDGSGKLVVVRLVSQDTNGVTCVECPAVRTLAQRVRNATAKRLVERPRQERVWGRTPGEVVVASTDVVRAIVVPPMALSRDPVFVATPPHTPPLLTMIDTTRVITVEMALVGDKRARAGDKIEPLPTTPFSTVRENLCKLALETGTITRQAQVAIRYAIISHALALGYAGHTRMMTVRIPGFGLRKLFSLDVGDVVDIMDNTRNLVGYFFMRSADEEPVEGEPHPRVEAASFMDTIDCRGLALNKLDRRGDIRYTQYMTFAEHPECDNELMYNLATEELIIKVGVRWWDTALEQKGGVPLAIPSGKEGHEFAVVDDDWHETNDVPFVNLARIRERFPLYQDKHYR